MTPPVSGSSNGGPPPRMSNGMNRHPSPPNSVARSSYGTNASMSENQRRQAMRMEEKLSQHYTILKRYLAQSLREEKASAKPNRARDKLLRLSAIQFQELSTDVYDELLRRQSAQGQQTNGPGQVPAYLLPKENFHPKRNQARQKLATLPSSRFRDLATDVFYELERRFPHFTGRDIPRGGSPAMYGPPSRVGTPNGMRGGGPGYGHPPRNASLGSVAMAGIGIPGPGQEDEYGRLTAKTFQSNTIIPNKSTMVEDDDDDGLSDVYGGRRDTTYTSRSVGGSERDRKAIADLEAQVGDSHDKIKEMEDRLRDKENELNRLHETHDEREHVSGHSCKRTSIVLTDFKATGHERQQWDSLRADLEARLQDAQNFHDHLQSELDRVQVEKRRNERDLQSQLDAIGSRASGDNEWKDRYESLDRTHQDLRSELVRQEATTSEVRGEATDLLHQLKALSQRSDESLHREEEQIRRLHQLEAEISEWKNRYAQARTQSRNGSGSSGMQPPSMPHLSRDSAFAAPDGLVKDLDVTKFQMGVDELLRNARSDEPGAVMPEVKAVVVAVRNISLAIGDDQGQSEQLSKLKAKVSATMNNLITASRNFAFSNGLTPVSLLDAAASHLSTAIVELLRIVKIRSTANGLGYDEDQNSVLADSPADYYGFSHTHSSVDGDSVVSPVQSPQYAQHAQRGIPTSIGQPGKTPAVNGVPNGVANYPKPSQAMSNGPADAKIEELKASTESYVCLESAANVGRTEFP